MESMLSRLIPIGWPRRERAAPIALPEQAHILVVKAAGIGDLLLAVPALRVPQAAGLVQGAPFVDRVLAVDKVAVDYPRQVLRAPWRLWPLIALWRRVRAADYDTVLLMHHLTLPFGRLKYRLLLSAAHKALWVGLDNGHGAFLDVRVPDEGFGAQHEATYCMRLVEAVGAHPDQQLLGPSLADLGWEDDPLGEAVAWVANMPRPLVALHPGSGTYSPARRWPLERFAALAEAVHHEFDASVVVLSGPDDGALGAQYADMLNRPSWLFTLPSSLPIRDVAAVLAHCDLFVGNDSLPMHLAAAAGTPVIAIFGPSNASAWKPLPPSARSFVTVVRRELPCSPCFYRGHSLGTPQGCAGRACLTGLEVDTVLAEVRRGLRHRPAVGAARL
jgi:ADP-heptose:LPS heptosyltransferase